MLLNFKNYIREAFNKGTSINDYNIKSAALIGTIGHPLFAFLHLYLFKMPWDSISLKIYGGIICLFLLTRNNWPKKIKPLFSFYWHFMLIYNLSFLITLTALNNSFIKTWFLWEVIMIFILIMYVPHWLIFLFDLLVGILLALFCHSVLFGGNILEPLDQSYNSHLDFWLYISTFMFAILAGLVFSYSNAKGIASGERAKIFKSLAGSIAHEIRNPLNAINLVSEQISDLATNLPNKSDNPNHLSQNLINSKSKLLELTYHIGSAVSNANNIIDIILGDLSEKKIDPRDFIYLESDKIIPSIIESYGYRNDQEREKVKFLAPQNPEHNFIFKAVPDRLTYIIFNLLKNALYYLHQFPQSVITIGTENRDWDGQNYNVIYVNDTGPGIPPHIITKLFNDFFSSGKKEGTGLGLSFCKRNMQIFGGDIICESEFGKWTRFSLLFPKLNDEEINDAKNNSNKKKILLVDDQQINLSNFKSKLEKTFNNIICDTVNNGKEAIKMARRNNYQLILMDIEMPNINGIETTNKIRIFNKNVPIIAFTSLNKSAFLNKINNINFQNEFNNYLHKLSQDNLIYRGVSKWLDNDDNLDYLGTKDDYISILKGKKVILADDQQINRIMAKRNLEAVGLQITEACDGKELIEIYQNSLDYEGKSSFDIILTDINMPPFDGDIASKEIRKIEASNGISHHDEIPIIALSGNGSEEDIHHFFACQITDYFVKGSKHELLLKIMATYLK